MTSKQPMMTVTRDKSDDAGTWSRAFAPSVLGNFSRAAVAVDGEPCAKIAK